MRSRSVNNRKKHPIETLPEYDKIFRVAPVEEVNNMAHFEILKDHKGEHR